MNCSNSEFSPTSTHKVEKSIFFPNTSFLNKIHWEDFKKWQSPEKFYHKITSANVKFEPQKELSNKKKIKKIYLQIPKKINTKKCQPILKDLDFYLDVLRRLELLKFNGDISRTNNENKEINVSIQNLCVESVNEQKCFDSISNNLGKNYFCNFYYLIILTILIMYRLLEANIHDIG